MTSMTESRNQSEQTALADDPAAMCAHYVFPAHGVEIVDRSDDPNGFDEAVARPEELHSLDAYPSAPAWATEPPSAWTTSAHDACGVVRDWERLLGGTHPLTVGLGRSDVGRAIGDTLQITPGPPTIFIDVTAPSDGMTAADARMLARTLVRAAELLEGA